MAPDELYDRDFYEWTKRTADLLRAGRVAEADLRHIAEEIEDMGKRERRALLSRLGVLIGHLLKWQAQPESRSRSWQLTLKLQRREIRKLLAEMPSLRRFLEDNLADAHANGVLLAAVDTHLPEEDFPQTCPFTLDQLLDEEYLP